MWYVTIQRNWGEYEEEGSDTEQFAIQGGPGKWRRENAPGLERVASETANDPGFQQYVIDYGDGDVSVFSFTRA